VWGKPNRFNVLIIVTAPDALYNGKFAGTFYIIPETADDAKKHAEYNLMVQEAEAMQKADKYGASLRMQAAFRFLVLLLAKADFITVDEVMKPEYNFGRVYALGMLGKLFRGALKGRQLKEFKEEKYRRIQRARFALKNLVERGLGDRWQSVVAAGGTS